MSVTINGTSSTAAALTAGTASNNVVQLDSFGHLPAVDGSQLIGMPYSFRNKIINGDMRIDQRFNGAASTPSALGTNYQCDRWATAISVASKVTTQQVVDAPAGFKFSLKVTVAAQYNPVGAADQFDLYQPVEGQNIVDLQFGTASALPISVSFWFKASVSGNYPISIVNAAGTQSYISNISATSTWTKFVLSIPGSITGTWNSDNTVGLILAVGMGNGSNYVGGSTGTWLSGNYRRTSSSITFTNQTVGSTLNITGVQLEAGNIATPFESRPIGTELALCQRYYEYGNMVVLTAVTNVAQAYSFKVVKRASPTMICTPTSGSGAVLFANWPDGFYQSIANTVYVGAAWTASAEL